MSEIKKGPEISPKYEVKESKPIPDWIVNEAHLINEALDKDVVTKEEAQKGLEEDVEILQMMRDMIDISYFVEYPPENVGEKDRGNMLMKLFSQEFETPSGEKKVLAEYLAEKRQGVSLAMITLDDSTAEAVRFLNKKGVPVIGWVVVDDIEGYWTNMANTKETIEKTQQIRDWAEKNDLVLEALGFDIEQPIQINSELASALESITKLHIADTVKRIRSWKEKRIEYKSKVESIKADGREPEQELKNLIANLESEGVKVESYEFPGIMRNLGITGVMEVPIKDRVIEMTYTSTLPGPAQKLGMRFMKSEGTIAALGIVSGKEEETPGRDLTGSLPRHLTTKELAHDINQLLNRELNLKDRILQVRDLYLFALNDARVAIMLEKAMNEAFGKQLNK